MLLIQLTTQQVQKLAAWLNIFKTLSDMKIHQLPLGARFEYEGEEYAKTGPQLGTGKHGQRLIPKYAVLKVTGGGAAEKEKSAESLSRKAMLEAFDRFYACCESIVPADRQAELRAARDAFMKAIG